MEGLGIDYRLLILQVANFLVLLFVLKKWVYKPFLKFLDERAEKIQESLKASEKMRQELKDFEAKKRDELQSLKERSQSILETVKAEAHAEKSVILDQASAEAKSLVEAARQQIGREREETIKGIRKEVADLSLEMAKKILADVDEERARRLIDQTLKETIRPGR